MNKVSTARLHTSHNVNMNAQEEDQKNSLPDELVHEVMKSPRTGCGQTQNVKAVYL